MLFILSYLFQFKQDADGDTALHIAVGRDQSESIALLLEAGAVPDAKNDNGFSAMHCAAIKGKKL